MVLRRPLEIAGKLFLSVVIWRKCPAFVLLSDFLSRARS